jgi:hypothetical protein
MGDFDFMSSGLGDCEGGAYEDKVKEFITAMLSLFISKALENSVQYVEICDRNGITKLDLEMALKYQASEFFKNPNLNAELEEVKEEIRQEMEEYDSEDYEDEDYAEAETEDGEAEEVGEAEDSEAEEVGEAEEGSEAETEDAEDDCGRLSMFEMDNIFQQIQTEDENVTPFKRANLREVEVEKRNFIQDFHQRTDNWGSWVPENDMEKAIFNAIETMTSQF